MTQANDTTFVSQSLPVISAAWSNDVNAAALRINSAIPGVTAAMYQKAISAAAERPTFKSFGAVGDGVTDDTAAIQAAFTSIAIVGGTLYPSPGTYLCSAKISVTTAFGINVFGAGSSDTLLIFTDGATLGGGLDITYTDSLYPPKVSGLGIQTKGLGVSSSTGLKITGPDLLSVQVKGPVVYDIQVRGFAVSADAWDVGIELNKVWYPILYDFGIKGQDNTVTQTLGLKLSSVQGAMISKFVAFHLGIGVYEATGGGLAGGEGLLISNFEIVGVTGGILLGNEGVKPGTSIGPGHINATDYLITATDRYQMEIHGILGYKTGNSTANWIGFSLADCDGLRIHHNYFEVSPGATGNAAGIQLSGTTRCDWNTVDSNQFRNFTAAGAGGIGIVIGTGAGNNLFTNNVCDSTVNTPYSVAVDADKTNKFRDNFPLAEQTLPTGATPSIGNDLGGPWITANVGATNITNLTNGYPGQEVEILLNEANTTFVDGAVMNLEANASLTGSGAIMTLRLYGAGVWREVCRRAA